MPIEQPGVYTIPLQAYLDDPAPAPSLSTSIAHRLLDRSPRHAMLRHPKLNPAMEREESSRLDLGTIAHALLLEGDASRIVPVVADDWRTKAAREERDAARAAGKLPILEAQFAQVEIMVQLASQAIAESELAEAWAGGTSEQTLVWLEHGVWCRSRPDRRADTWRVLFDYKTAGTSGHPLAWGRTHVLAHGYDLQAALALRGVRRLQLARTCTFVFVVQEVEPPYAVSFVGLDPAFLELAEQKLTAALDLWRECLSTDVWPGYPSRVAYLEPPRWALEWNYLLPQMEQEAS